MEVKKALIDLYLNVKVRSKTEIEAYTEAQLQEERQNLYEAEPEAIIEYIRTSIEILMNLKVEDY